MGVPDTLRLGSSGDLVVELQRFLEGHLSGSMTIPPDISGEFDEATEAAVRAFQHSYGIEDDGVVGPDTWVVIAEVDPHNWEEGSDNNPMQMEAMVFGSSGEEPPADAYAEPIGPDLQARVDPQLAVLVAVVDVRMQAQPLPPDLLDPSAPSAASERWLQELEVVKGETRRHFLAVARHIDTSVENLGSNWKSYQDELRGAVGRVAEHLAGANALNDTLTDGDFDYPLSLTAGARAALDQQWFAEAARNLEEASQSVVESERRYHALIEETRGAATFALHALELTKDASFFIVTAIAAGEIIAAYEITSLLGAAAVEATVSLAGDATETLATGLGHVFADSTEEFDLTEELAEDVKSAPAAFAGGAIGGYFVSSFGEKFADEVASKLTTYLGEHAEAWVKVALEELLEDSASSLTEAVMVTSVDGLVGRKFESKEAFVAATVDEWMNGLGGAKAEIVADAYRVAADSFHVRGEPPPVKELLVQALRDGLLGSGD